MTNQKTNEPKAKGPVKDRFQEEFEALPLEKKLASLWHMETATLSETLDYVVNSPMKVVQKVGDAIAQFGIKLEAEVKNAASSHKAATEPPAAAKGPAAKPKSRPAKKSPPPSAPK